MFSAQAWDAKRGAKSARRATGRSNGSPAPAAPFDRCQWEFDPAPPDSQAASV